MNAMSSPSIMPALLTYEDYCEIPEDGNRYEVIRGSLFMSPTPFIRHQQIVTSLGGLLYRFVKDVGAGIALVSPVDVVLSEENVVQPDIVFISKVRQSIVSEKNVQGAPDLVVEILSEGNRRHDEVTKRKLYERFGVQEYWIVDPELETMKIYRLENEAYNRIAELSTENSDTLRSQLLPGFECDLKEMFG